MGNKNKSNQSDVDLFSYSKRRVRKKFDFVEFLLKPPVMISITAVIVVCMLLSSVLLSFRYNYNSAFGGFSDNDLGITADLPDDVLNIALFGIDTRSTTSFSGNSDSIMIISIDSKTNSIKLTSIMRDSLIKIPGYSASKINSAYAKGGPSLAVKTLNQNFGLNISDYCTVNFSGMKQIIDAVGGITATLTKAEVKDANKHLKYQAMVEGIEPDYIEHEGEQVLSGIQAVSYARIRYAKNPNGNTDDFGRTDRQRYVMEQLFNKALEMKSSKYPAFIKSILPYMETSLDYKEILNLAAFLNRDVKFLQARIPSQEYVINDGFKLKSGASTVYYNIDYAAKVLHAFLYENVDPDAYIKLYGVDKTGWYETVAATSSSSQSGNVPSDSGSSDTQSDTSSEPVSSNTSSSDTSNIPSDSSDIISSGFVSSNDETQSNNTSSDNLSSDFTSSSGNESDFEITSSNTDTSSELTSSAEDGQDNNQSNE